MAYNSDGYIMLDFIDVDFKKTNQIIDGMYERCQKIIGTNKFCIVINANGKTPLPSAVSKTNGQYVIESVLFNFTISSNDNLNIKKNTPVSEIIDDNHIYMNTTWSSYKIDSQITQAADNLVALLPQKKHATLPAGQTMLSIVDDSFFEDNKTYWVGTNKFGVMPTNVEVNLQSPKSINIVFGKAQGTDIEVEVLKL